MNFTEALYSASVVVVARFWEECNRMFYNGYRTTLNLLVQTPVYIFEFYRPHCSLLISGLKIRRHARYT